MEVELSSLPRPCLGAKNPATGAFEQCGKPVTGASRCDEHEANFQATRRPSPTDRGYDKTYREDRAELLKPDAQGRRRVCSLKLPGCTYWADTADHVLPVDSGRNKMAFRGPLRPACAHCNSSRGKRNVGPASLRPVVDEPPRDREVEADEPWTPDP